MGGQAKQSQSAAGGGRRKQIKTESVSLGFWKSGLWPDMRGLGEKSEMNHEPITEIVIHEDKSKRARNPLI